MYKSQCIHIPMPSFNAPARRYILKQRRLLTAWPLVELVKIQKAIFMQNGKVVFISVCLKQTHFSSFLFECLIQNSYLFCLPKSTFSANQYFCSAFWKLSKSIKIFIFGKQTKRSTTVHEKSRCWKKKLFIEKTIETFRPALISSVSRTRIHHSNSFAQSGVFTEICPLLHPHSSYCNTLPLGFSWVSRWHGQCWLEKVGPPTMAN